MVGTDGVAKLEDLAYGVQDKVNQARRSDEAPQAYWSASGAVAPAAFHPTDAGPMLKNFGAPGDGVWVPVPDERGGVSMYKTLLHPDPKRSWTEVFVYAIDYKQFELHLVAGYQEPKSGTPEGLAKFREGTSARAAIIPESDRERLVAAFNGGFMAQHGHWGMRVDGITVLPPKPAGCTVARLQNGSLRIGTFTALAAEAENAGWYRQTPPCMIEQGKLHPGLDNPDAKSWGATLSGATIIRRSAIGLDPTGQVMFVAMGNSTSARALALAMQHVGAIDVAQLDVNYSYPKILFYKKKDDGNLVAEPGAPGFVYQPGEYVNQRSMRDFFYLTRR